MVQYVSTPFFMFNSRFDLWQLQNIEQVPCMQDKVHDCNDSERAAITQYGTDFLSQFAIMPTLKGNGAFITSCICHGCPWSDVTLSNHVSLTLYVLPLYVKVCWAKAWLTRTYMYIDCDASLWSVVFWRR